MQNVRVFFFYPVDQILQMAEDPDNLQNNTAWVGLQTKRQIKVKTVLKDLLLVSH